MEQVKCTHCHMDQQIDMSILEGCQLDIWDEMVICEHCDEPFTITVERT